ncbi:nuclear transport factor 2 family protein [Acinetobacter baumannii]|uniref:nuclear transport factor 2 family protein n=1 Tax=Acinetobacter calcoaceticus/baumannii complex TaxID=909768 RepID=UPI0013B6E69B|nr:nuclear transport factor 2 family protein [Acinetobacter baumannii]NDX18460.1 nuclear transport factor 2 family protein [Acinetobacter baumannii]NDX37862.1 nuclear transport factor 2 family protein [Acinetobacter baumannii]
MNKPNLQIQTDIEHLIRYFAYLNDQKQYETLINLFSEDSTYARPSLPDVILSGKTEILDSFVNRIQKHTQHVVANILIDQQTPDLVIAHSQIILYNGNDHQNIEMMVIGGFNDEIILDNQYWKFKKRRGFINFTHKF